MVITALSNKTAKSCLKGTFLDNYCLLVGLALFDYRLLVLLLRTMPVPLVYLSSRVLRDPCQSQSWCQLNGAGDIGAVARDSKRISKLARLPRKLEYKEC